MRILFALAVMVQVATASAEEQRSIKVTAKSEVKVAPDEVVLQLAVHTRDEDLLTARRENDRIAAEVIGLTSKHSVPPADVQVTNLDVSPDYVDDTRRRQSKPVAYDFTRQIEVRLTDFTKIEPLLSDAFDAGLSHVNGLQFRVRNQRQHQFEARTLAVTYAKEKAEHLTGLTGMTLGAPLSMEEDVEHNWDAGGFGGGIGAFRGNEKANRIAINDSDYRFVVLQQKAEKSSEPLIAPGQIVITAEVTIEFEMSKR